MKKAFKIILEILTFIIICLSLYIIIEVTIANVKNRPPRIFNVSVSYVPTDSMKPVIEPGDYVIYVGASYEDIKEQDIIVYYNESIGKYIIHRVIEVNTDGNYMITKGDNNLIADTVHVTKDNLVGKYIGKAGILKIFAGGIDQTVVFIILIILLIAFISLQIVSIVLKGKKEELVENKNKTKEELLDEMRKELIEEIKEELKNNDKKD